MSAGTSFVCSISTARQDITLRSDSYAGTVVKFKNIGARTIRIYKPVGGALFDDSTQDDYHNIPNGDTAEVVCLGVISVNGINKTT